MIQWCGDPTLKVPLVYRIQTDKLGEHDTVTLFDNPVVVVPISLTRYLPFPHPHTQQILVLFFWVPFFFLFLF